MLNKMFEKEKKEILKAGTYDIKLKVNWAEGTAKCEMTKK